MYLKVAESDSVVQIITDLAWLLVRVNADHVQGTLESDSVRCQHLLSKHVCIYCLQDVKHLGDMNYGFAARHCDQGLNNYTQKP